jgi:catechol 2,3-dioxygenase-like lactoylglutathione lyase family enzyme
MITGIHHVQITVPKGEEEAARKFYCGTLQLAEIAKPDVLKSRGGFWLAVGDRQVHVGTEEGANRLATKAHVAYAVDDIEPWRKNLTALGIRIEEGLPIPGYSRFEFRDPFGNRVEMIQSIS